MIVKLSPNVARHRRADAADRHRIGGADALTLDRTRCAAMAIDVETRQPRLSRGTGGLSGPAIHPIAVRLVHEVNDAVARDAGVAVVGLGGVMTWRDAAELVLAGATAVGLGTALFVDPRTPKRGPFAVRDGKRKISKQHWKAGRLVDLDGITPYPKDLDALRVRVAALLDTETPLLSGATKKPKRRKRGVVLAAEESPALGAGRDAALRRLSAYRYVCDVPYEGMSLDDGYNRKCLAASRLLERIGRLDHTPDNPGLPEDEYRVAYEGTSSSNIAVGSSLPGSIDMYMNDSDASNIARVGHRRWCLNPAMLKTGFGITGRWSAMWSFDSSRTSYDAPDLICYRARLDACRDVRRPPRVERRLLRPQPAQAGRDRDRGRRARSVVRALREAARAGPQGQGVEHASVPAGRRRRVARLALPRHYSRAARRGPLPRRVREPRGVVW